VFYVFRDNSVTETITITMVHGFLQQLLFAR